MGIGELDPQEKLSERRPKRPDGATKGEDGVAACAHVGVGGSGRRAERDGGGNDGRGAEHGRGTGRYGNIPPGRREPRSASDAGTPLPASESECPAGRGAERHEEERREPRGASDAGTTFPASESECRPGRPTERHEEEL